MAKYSAFFIIKNAKKEDQDRLIKLIKKSDEDRETIACFEVTKSLFGNKYKNLNILSHTEHKNYCGEIIDETWVFFKKNLIGDLVAVDEKEININEELLVIKSEQIVKNLNKFKKEIYKRKIISIGLQKLMLYNTSVHSQYSGKKLEHLDNNPYYDLELDQNNIENLKNEFLSNKNEAEKKGCTIKNKSFFFLKHVFMDTTKSYFDFMHKTKNCIISLKMQNNFSDKNYINEFRSEVRL